MKKFDEWQLPDKEAHLQHWMRDVNDRQHGRLCYQGHKYRAAVKHCKQRRMAVDVGAHVGLWSFMMAHEFERVKCWEPMVEHAACWRENMGSFSNCELIENALGARDGFVKLATYTPDSSGDTRVSSHATTADTDYVSITTLDSYGLVDVDFMKVDCEGYELFVLQGAKQTLLRCKPVVIVEQKRDMHEQFGVGKLAAVEYLESLGAHRISDVGGDYILGWE